MRIKHKQLAILFALGLLSVSFVRLAPVVTAAPTTSATQVPATIASCLPHTIAKVYAIGPVVDGDTNYYLVRGQFTLRKGEPLLWGHFLVATDRAGCALLNSPNDASTLLSRGVSAYVQRDAARKIALARWQDNLKQYPDKAAFEREVKAGLAEGPDRTVLVAEDIWALARMGIDVKGTVSEEESP